MPSFQPGNLYEPLSTGKEFTRTYERAQGTPYSGVTEKRLYSTFVIRPVLPSILNEDALPLGRGRNIYSAAARTRDFSREPPRPSSVLIGNLSRLNPSVLRTGIENFRLNNARATRDPSVGPPRPLITDEATARAIALQVQAMANAQPLLFLINPQSMQVQHQKIQQNTDRSRDGSIFQAWGEEPQKLSFSCQTAAFMAGAPLNASPSRNGQGRLPTGVQFAAKRNSPAFHQLMSLLTLYKSGGHIRDILGESNSAYMIGNTQIEYDQNVYWGHMDTFSWGYEADSPNSIKFDFEFTALKTYDLATLKSAVTPLRMAPTSSRGAFSEGAVNQQTNQESRTFSAPTNQIQVFTPSGVGRLTGSMAGIQPVPMAREVPTTVASSDRVSDALTSLDLTTVDPSALRPFRGS